MKNKLLDSRRKCLETKREMKLSKVNLGNVFRMKTIVRKKFMEILDNEIKYTWNSERVKNDKKI